jgi:RNA polymerase sigma-70 factor (ECF subfamily)
MLRCDAVRGDVELLDAWRGGDEEAGGELFERHFVCVVRFFRNKVNREIEDLVQKTFLGCVEGRDRFRGDSSFRSYLFGIAHNVLKAHFRDKKRDGEIDFGVSSVQALQPGQSTIAAQKSEHRLLCEALRRIPFDFQVALELFYWEKMTAPEIASVLDIPEGTARSRIRLGRERLLEHMSALADAPGGVDATVDDLDRWAHGLRDQVLLEQTG